MFFLYKKYKWSIGKRDDGIYLWFYPNVDDLESLLQYEDEGWAEVDMVCYKAIDIGTKEAVDSFSELYSLVSEKVYGVDLVLEDIISDDDF